MDESDKFNEIEPIFFAITRERLYQDEKYGTPEHRNLSLARYLLIIRKELNEAMDAIVDEETDEETDEGALANAMCELLQVAAVAVAAMEQHGIIERFQINK